MRRVVLVLADGLRRIRSTITFLSFSPAEAAL